MQIIAAYPCLGKTTIYQLNKDKCFDREFCESRSTLGMTPEQQDRFFDNCAEIVRVQYEANYHKVLFITEDERLLSRLEDLKKDIILVFPAVDNLNPSIIRDYIDRVIERSGEAWFKRVLEPEIPTLQERSELPRPIEVGASCFNHHSFVNDIRYRSLTRCPQA